MNQQPRMSCDMRTAPDTPEDRAAEYQQLFATALCGRDQTERMVRFRFRADAVDEAQVRSLAAREQACCPFFDIQLSTVDDQLWWETRVDDKPQAKACSRNSPGYPTNTSGPPPWRTDLIGRDMLVTGAADPSVTTPTPRNPSPPVELGRRRGLCSPPSRPSCCSSPSVLRPRPGSFLTTITRW